MVSNRIGWSATRESIDLAKTVTRELGPAPGRRGERGGRLWWRCPFHPDVNPSFAVRPGERFWRCFGCGVSGDAVDFVRRLHPGLSFPETVSYLTGDLAPSRPLARAVKPLPAPSGLAEKEALTLALDAEERLWEPDGEPTLGYLRGRGLADATLRAARLGLTWGVSVPGANGNAFRAAGVVIPWFVGDRLALIKIRQPDGRQPRYVEAFRDPLRVVCYPSPEVVEAGLPVVVTEGELDALLLAQELDGLAAVVTLGSASSKPNGRTLSALLPAFPWYLATDADDAGDRAAAAWPAQARRVRPPGSFKDWTETRQVSHPVNLRRWWADVFAGNPRPPLYTWDELSTWRW